MDEQPKRIAILGAGPIGLECGLYARFLGFEVAIFERGEVAENVLAWGHVQMFSPFSMNCSPLGLAALSAQDADYEPPDEDALLTGRQWADSYLLPLARTDLLADTIQTQTAALAVGRTGILKGESVGQPHRSEPQFRLLLNGDPKGEFIEAAEIVIDASGVFGNANYLGNGGIPAIGELETASRIEYGLPDVLGDQRDQYTGKRVLVVGAGYSAATMVVSLTELPGVGITWVTRRPAQSNLTSPVVRHDDDRLAQRDELAQRANALATDEGSAVEHLPGTWVESIAERPETGELAVRFSGEHTGQFLFDRVIANVGYRPDRSVYRELQIHECYATEGPIKLAAHLSSRTSTDCLNQEAGGAYVLRCPEPDFYVMGSKSYGRNSHFLYSLGLDQIRDLFTMIGDRADLDLYANIQQADDA